MKWSGLLLFSLLVAICSGKELENCRQVEMNPAKQDFILEKHVFKMMEIETASACEVNCFMEADCVSYNLKPQQNGKILCELSDSDHINNHQHLRYKKGTVYKSFKNRCPNALCPSTKRCQTGFTKKGYRCVCVNGLLGENCTEGPPSVEVVPEIIETVEGRNVIAMCNVTGNPRPNRITWKRSDGTLSSARTIVSEGNLTILNITARDNGSYVCTAANPWGHNSSSVILHVYSSLKFVIKPPSNVTVKASEELILPCSTSSDLKPTILWMYDGTFSLPSGAVVDPSLNALIIFSANISHSGTYTCDVTDAFSSIQTSVMVYVKYPETCTKVKANISDVSGDYHIDLDGVLGEDPFPVYCNMTDKGGVGVTVVGHDMENRTQVKGYEKRGEYSVDVHYRSASISQLKALTEASDNCQQFIKYECFHAKLIEYGYSWWVSRDGQNMMYWGGANLTTGGCACGVTRSCADDQSLKCNCDKNDKNWREDSGFLTNKSHLPVKQLRFGDTGQAQLHEEGYHTLGKLECYGMT